MNKHPINKRMNDADVVDIPTAAIITVAFRQIITCFPVWGGGGGWPEELIMCVCVCVPLCPQTSAGCHPQFSKCCLHMEFTRFEGLGLREAFQTSLKSNTHLKIDLILVGQL